MTWRSTCGRPYLAARPLAAVKAAKVSVTAVGWHHAAGPQQILGVHVVWRIMNPCLLREMTSYGVTTIIARHVL